MSLEGTNTYVVTTGDGAYVIDPGPDDPEHLDRVRDVAGGAVTGALLTHGHVDHSEGVAALGAPLLWGEAARESEMEALRKALESGWTAELGALPPHTDEKAPTGAGIGPFTLIATPGHAADHVAFVLGDVCFCGDLILGRGSSIVPPAAAGGSLGDYMRSLDAIEALGAELLAPGHGPWVTDPAAKVAEYRAHRLQRERDLLAALDRGERSRARLLDAAWSDVPEPMRPAASWAMQAHLEKLAAEGRVDLGELTA